MSGRFRLEGASESARIVAAYDPATDSLTFDSDGRFWKAIRRAHDLGARGAGHNVAIVDTMCDLAIPRLSRQLRSVSDSADSLSLDAAKLSHGTAVGLLIAHVAPDCRFDFYSILDGSGTPQLGLAVEALQEAARSDAQVINISAGNEHDFAPNIEGDLAPQLTAALKDLHGWLASFAPDEPDCPLCQAAAKAVEAGKLVFAAAGNDPHVICCPARAAGVTAVGFQQTTRKIVNAADGNTLEVASSDATAGESRTFDLAIDEINGVLGTSFACPLYAGAGALGVSGAEMRAYMAATRFGQFAMMLHAGLSSGPADRRTVDATRIFYERALASLPHVHCAAQAGLRPDVPHSDPSACWSCGIFAEDKYVNAGLFCLETGQLTAAESLLSAARQLVPWSPHAAANLGATYKQLGLLREAMACYDDALRLRPGFEVYISARESIRQSLL